MFSFYQEIEKIYLPIDSDYSHDDPEDYLMANEDKHYTRIGAFVLEILTTGMYRNPLDTLREWIWNTFGRE